MAEAMSVIMGIAYQQASLSRRYKKQKVSNNRHLLALLVFAERDWLLRSLRSLRLTPFPTARRRGPCKPLLGKKVINHLICFLHLCPQASLCPGYKKQKVSIARHLLALLVFAEREGFERRSRRADT